MVQRDVSCDAPSRSSINDSDVECVPTMGIRHVWVSKNARRSGVATALVDAARQRFSCGSLVKKSDIAFSQPTNDGLRFAFGYVRKESILSYA